MERFLWIAAWLMVAAAAHADPFDDFRIPDHTTRTGRVAFEASGSWHASSRPLAIHGLFSSTNLDVSLSYLKDSDAIQYSFGGNLQTSVSRDDGEEVFEGLFSPGLYRRSLRNDRLLQNTSLFASLRAYPWVRPVGVEFAASGSSSIWYSRLGMNARQQNGIIAGDYRDFRARLTDRSRGRIVRFTVAPGWGRIRDATVVFDVHVLEERLVASGTLRQPLSTDGREKLARIFLLRPSFAAVHERPDRFFWREVERTLVEDGALDAGGFDAYGLLFGIERLLPDANFQRLRGCFLGPVMEAEHWRLIHNEYENSTLTTFVSDSIVASEVVATSTRSADSFDSYHAGAKIEFHAPLGWRWQLDGKSQLTVPLRPGEGGFDAQTQARASWFIADRWHWNVRVDHQRRILDPRHSEDPRIDSWHVDYGTSLAYYLEDRTALQATLEQTQDKGEDSSGTHRWRRGTSLQLGITYRFLGALDAPGLIEPQRFIN